MRDNLKYERSIENAATEAGKISCYNAGKEEDVFLSIPNEGACSPEFSNGCIISEDL